MVMSFIKKSVLSFDLEFVKWPVNTPNKVTLSVNDLFLCG